MRALTLWQPWAWLVASGHKLIENRVWSPSPKLLAPGDRFAIHAGKRFEVGDWEGLLDVALDRGISIPNRADITLGAIIGTARLRDVVLSGDALGDQRAWFAGPYGWRLDEVRLLVEPVPCAGAMGLWRLPDGVEQLVLEREPKCLVCGNPSASVAVACSDACAEAFRKKVAEPA